jgi:hypothetical protein
VASVYLQQNAFDRLSSPVWNTRLDDETYDSLGDGKQQQQQQLVPVLDKATKKKNFQAFIRRQQAHVELKRARLGELVERDAKLATARHTNKVSERLLSVSGQGSQSFEERLRVSVQRREMRAATAHLLGGATGADDAEATFTPKITAYSKQLRARTPHELSRGEVNRRKVNLEIMRGDRKQDEMRGVTFAPKLLKSSGAASSSMERKGVLRVSTEPGSFVARMQAQSDMDEMQRARLLRMQREQEQRECTFHPVIRACPDYVKQIATSMQVAREQDKQAALLAGHGPEKPSWK